MGDIFTSAAIAWGVVALLFLITELMTGTLYVLCVFVGALAASFVPLFGGGFIAQVAVFAIFSLLALFFIRPVLLKTLKTKQAPKSNADAIIGRIGRVSQTIKAGDYGRVAIDGDDWKAESVESEDIPVGSKVEVLDRKSLILTVKTI